MIDHVGFPVSDYPRSKAFYEKALAPLGYVLVTEVQQDENDARLRLRRRTASRISGSAAKAR